MIAVFRWPPALGLVGLAYRPQVVAAAQFPEWSLSMSRTGHFQMSGGTDTDPDYVVNIG